MIRSTQELREFLFVQMQGLEGVVRANPVFRGVGGKLSGDRSFFLVEAAMLEGRPNEIVVGFLRYHVESVCHQKVRKGFRRLAKESGRRSLGPMVFHPLIRV